MNINIKDPSKSKKNKSAKQKFYDSVIQQIGALIIHTVGATIFILVTILLGIKCATSDGYWVYLLSTIICVAVTIACIGAVIIDACNMVIFIKELDDNKNNWRNN